MTAANPSDAEHTRAHTAAQTDSAHQVALIGHATAESVFAYRHGTVITAGEFVADVMRFKEELPDARWVINLAADRHLFAVALAAALLRDQVTLLPANLTPATIAELLNTYPAAYAVTDGLRPHPALRCVAITRATPSNTNAAYRVPTVAGNTTALILFTSGSTGAPVPTQKQWGPFLQSVLSEAEALGLSKHRGLSILGTVPAQHSYGLESTVLLPMLTGNALDAGKPFYPADICSALAALARPRMLVTTPVHLRALMRSQLLCPPVDLLLSATAPMPLDLACEAEERFRAPLMEIYGCSEAGQIATRQPLANSAWKLMHDIVLHQIGDGTLASGGHVPGVVRLADVIEIVDAQHFVLHGRGADLINIAGKRTSLAYLNHQLNAIEGVEDGVFLMPEDRGETVTRLTAFVVAPSLPESVILNALRERVDAVFLPRPLWRVERLPRNAAGKLPCEDLIALAHTLQENRRRK